MTTHSKAKTLSDFEHGYLSAMAQLIRLFDMPSLAAGCLQAEGLAVLDCTDLDEFDKVPLRALLDHDGIALTGLVAPAAEASPGPSSTGSRARKRTSRAVQSDEERKKKAIEAEDRGNRWLADGNAAAEAGNQEKADECYRKGQYWLDRFNKLTDRA